MNNIRNDIGNNHQGELEITAQMVTFQCRKMPDWKAPGRDGVQGFWLKKPRSLHVRIAEQLNDLLKGEEEVPEWLTLGRTILCLKDPSKGNAVDNFRPISCPTSFPGSLILPPLEASEERPWHTLVTCRFDN